MEARSVSVIDQCKGERWAAYNGDTVDVAKGLPDNSVHMSVYSPPFASMFTYSASERDFGNSPDYDTFWKQYDFLIAETMRVMVPGRIVAVHCMDLPTSKQHHGYIGLQDFPGDIVRGFQRHGFIFHSRITIWKCPVVAMTRTKALGLLYKQLKKDSAMSRQGVPDQVIVMRKPGPNPEPVFKKPESFPVDRWQKYASPVWVTAEEVDDEGFGIATEDIDQTDTLQVRSARDERDEKHLCALQLEVIRRCIHLWSNPNDVIWSPFMGIGSEGYVALKEGRRFVGAELKDTYFAQAVRNLQAAEAPPKQTSIFDLAGVAQ